MLRPIISVAAAVGLAAGSVTLTAGYTGTTAASTLFSLTSHSVLIEMGGTGQSLVPDHQLDTIAHAVNTRYGTDFTSGTNVDNLYTPEGMYNGTYLDGEVSLLNALAGYSDGDITVFGASQSAGIIGMAVRDIASGDLPDGHGGYLLDPGVTAEALPSNIHWVALAPPTVPLHGNTASLFQNSLFDLSGWFPHAQDPFPIDAGNVDVYCGMYDPVCDMPSSPNSFASFFNGISGMPAIHGGYGSLTPDEIAYEMDHATEFTIGPDGSVALYPDQYGAPEDLTHFFLMPDVYNWGTGTDPYYDSYLPALSYMTGFFGSLFGGQSGYEKWLPLQTLKVDSGYSDELHPFQYMIGGTEYTFYDPSGNGVYEVTPVTDLPDGITAPVVDSSDINGAMGSLASEIAHGIVSPTGTEMAADSGTWWDSLFGWL